MRLFLRMLRPRQWIKNLFVLAPLFFSGHLFDAARALAALHVTAVFCALASLVYVFNDLCDQDADRHHAKKRGRPLADGLVSRGQAWALAAGLVLVALLLVLAAPPPHAVLRTLGLYLCINVAYSLGLKHVPLVEMFLVASGFILRLYAGAEAIGAGITVWMLVCSGLASLLLVVAKRRADLQQGNDPACLRRALTGYSVPYLDALIVMLAGATLVAYLLFCTSAYGQEKYGTLLLLTGVFVVLGVFRFLQIVMMEQGGDSPTDLLTGDRILRLTLLAWSSTFFLLLYMGGG